jgi:hypothetical protein
MNRAIHAAISGNHEIRASRNRCSGASIGEPPVLRPGGLSSLRCSSVASMAIDRDGTTRPAPRGLAAPRAANAVGLCATGAPTQAVLSGFERTS